MKPRNLSRRRTTPIAVPAACALALAGAASCSADEMSVQLLDARSGTPIARAAVEVASDNGVRCETAPCPTNDVSWRGVSDANGFVTVPQSVTQAVTLVTAAGYRGKDLVSEAEQRGGGGWVLELYAERHDDSALDEREIKLVDAASNEPLAGVAVRVVFGEGDALETTTSPAGYIFIPFERAFAALEDTWVEVEGYRRTKIDYAATRYKTPLERR
jgi:hypothetical protein